MIARKAQGMQGMAQIDLVISKLSANTNDRIILDFSPTWAGRACHVWNWPTWHGCLARGF